MLTASHTPAVDPGRPPASAGARPALRRCACGGIPGHGGECAACRAKRLARRRPSAAPAVVHEVLRSAGEPLPKATRAPFEARLGADLSAVRVHTDSRAAESARALDAAAYTVGRDVVFDHGRYAPGAAEGRRLLAHELTHVVQQQGAGSVPAPLEVGPIDDPAEREARRIADGVGSRPTPSRSVLRRAPLFSPECDEFQRCQVIEPLVHARQMVDAALRELPPIAAGTVVSGRIVDLLNVHFHAPGDVAGTAQTVLDKLTALRRELDQPVRYVCHANRPAECETTESGFVGGFTDCAAGADIHLCDLYYVALSCPEAARVLVHESAHHVDGLCGDRAYVGDPAYMALPSEDALANADSYAQFAAMAFMGAPSCVRCDFELQRAGGKRYPPSPKAAGPKAPPK